MIPAAELKGALDLQELPRLYLLQIRKVYTLKTEAHNILSSQKHPNRAYVGM